MRKKYILLKTEGTLFIYKYYQKVALYSHELQ